MAHAPASYPSLEGRAAFVTGGATGIGAALVEAFCRQGAHVGFVDVDVSAAKELVAALETPGRPQVWFRPVDVTETKDLQAAMADFSTVAGGLHVLINNAGNDARHDPLAVTQQQWRDCLAINLDSMFFAAQAAIGLMKQASGGSIVTLGSINAVLGAADMPGYVAAKSALLGLTKSLARQYGRDGIRVNVILPGWVVTPRQLELWLTPEAEAAWMDKVALKERILPHDVADLALFLASASSSKITGQSFTIDGGRT